MLETRFDTVLPTLATKADLAELRMELLVKIEALRADLIKWMAATLITILLSFVGLFVVLTRALALTPTPHVATAPAVEPATRGGFASSTRHSPQLSLTATYN